jgi:alpha/beta superfamily hydrolase
MVNIQTQRLTLSGPAGQLESLRDEPLHLPPGTHGRGVAVIAHPHPLYGGTMNNKVVQTLARAFVQCGFTAVRFNFRGVGASAGAFDHGVGEVADLLGVVDQVAPAGMPLALAGFSFGAFTSCQAVATLWPRRALDSIVLVGTAASRFEVAPLPPEAHERTLVVHGEQDDTVPLAAVMDWARPQMLPVTVIPGVEHFFHGQLTLLKHLVVRHLNA